MLYVSRGDDPRSAAVADRFGVIATQWAGPDLYSRSGEVSAGRPGAVVSE